MDSSYTPQQIEIYYSARKDRLSPLERSLIEDYLKTKGYDKYKRMAKKHSMQPMKAKYLLSSAVSKLIV